MNAPHLPRCRECRFLLPPGARRCVNRKCRAWNVAKKVALDDSTVLLSQACAVKVERVATGLVDKVFGGGIAMTSVNLLAGDPGAGKTTLCLQLSELFLFEFLQKEVLYIANEQSAEEIAETAARLKLMNLDRIRVVRAMGGVTHDIGDLMIGYKPCLILLDSITKWVGEDMAMAVVLAQRIKDYSVKLKAPTIIVNQVTKDGDHAGRKQLEHAVDMAAMFETMIDVLDDEGNPVPAKDAPRRLQSSKNRFGPAPEEQFYKMTATGLEEIQLGA
jgi:DNA repair protein RadA/Sms